MLCLIDVGQHKLTQVTGKLFVSDIRLVFDRMNGCEFHAEAREDKVLSKRMKRIKTKLRGGEKNLFFATRRDYYVCILILPNRD